MRYTEYKYNPEHMARKTEQTRKNLKKNTGKTDLTAFGAQVLADRIKDDRLRYRDFGPYWWALKEILIEQGLARGTTMDHEMAAEYRQATTDETVVAADDFQTYYLKHFFVYTNTFLLGAEEEWTLYDPDYEKPF